MVHVEGFILLKEFVAGCLLLVGPEPFALSPVLCALTHPHPSREGILPLRPVSSFCHPHA